MLFGKAVEHSLHPENALLLFEFFVGVVSIQRGVDRSGIDGKMTGIFLFGTVNGQIATDGQTIAFQMDVVRYVGATFPHTHQCVFDHILGFEAVERDAQRYPIKFVFKGSRSCWNLFLSCLYK